MLPRILVIIAALALLGVLGGGASHAGTADDADIVAMIARVEESNIAAHVRAISKPRNALEEPAQLEATADYIEGWLETMSYDVARDDVTVEDATFPNLVADLPGTTCPERVMIVGAHYDSVAGTPGADDDASGVAGMLEIARALSDAPLPATVRFVAFALEEENGAGSREMASALADEGAEIVGMYSLEMIGYTDQATQAEFIVTIGSASSVRLTAAFAAALAAYVPELPAVTLTTEGNGESSPDVRRSDHAPFWDAGYQALLVTDTANFRNPNYHRPSDTLETLDLPFATNVTKATLATTMSYLTADDDADGTPDVCVSPLAATATPSPTETPAPAPTATGTPAGIVAPDTGTGREDGVAPRGWALGLGLTGLLALTLGMALRRAARAN